MLKFIWVTFLFITLIQLIEGLYNHTAYNICLSCRNVKTPQDCTHFEEIWQNEVCTTERVMTLNGTTVWNFGFEDAKLCTGDELIRTSRSVSARRVRASQQPRFVLCHECCHTSLCNHKLCGSPTNNDLLCLSGEETRDLPPISHAVYCSQNQSCYASMRMNSRPGQVPINYGCVLKDECREFHNMDSHGHCQGCCEIDGCNANICLVQPSDVLFTNCSDLQWRGGIHESGVYKIHPIQGSNASLNVRCDMVTDGGGWTVLQRRFDGSLNFTRIMSEYVEGFGDVSGEHWLGLKWINSMTSHGAVQVRVDLCRFDDRAGYAVYEGFSVSGPGDTYTLHAGVYRNGSMEDWLSYHNGSVFRASSRCADWYRGGWWWYQRDCDNVNLNGGLYNGGTGHGIVWPYFGGHGEYSNVRSSELKIRPLNTPGDPAHPYTCPP